jgi:hypothetical protein
MWFSGRQFESLNIAKKVNEMNWILVVVTFLGGNSWGPVVHTQVLRTELQCQAAAKAVIARVDDMAKTNATATGQTVSGVTAIGRQVVSTTATCKRLPN